MIIIDNSSETPVTSLLDDDILSVIKVHRNQVNIGGAANIARCFELCETDWLWTLSDDDIVCPDAVNTILRTIKTVNDVCYINFNNIKTFSNNSFAEVLKNSGLYQDFYYMSVCLYNMTKLRSYLHHYYRGLSTMQPGVYMLIKYLDENRNDKCMISNERIVNSGSNDISWNRMTFIYASLYLLDLLRDKKKEYRSGLFRSIIADCGYCAYDSYRRDYISLYEVIGTFIDMIKRRGLFTSFVYDSKVYAKNQEQIFCFAFLRNNK